MSNFPSLISLLLCSSVLINIIHTTESNEDQQNQQIDQTDSNKLKFDDLNYDVMRLIFNEFGPFELIQMAETNSKYNYLAHEEFRRNYRNHEIRISKCNHQFRVRNNADTKYIVVSEEMAPSLLRTFGCDIKSLFIFNHFISRNRSASINRIANEYASKSVTQLDVGSIHEDTLKQFTGPFENVEYVKCSIHTKSLPTNIMPFNRLFPKLCSLKIVLYNDLDYNFIDCAFQHLWHLDITIDYNQIKKRDHQINELLRKNPQIKSINAKHFSPDFIIVINEHFPNLEILMIEDFTVQPHQTVHFAGVKYFQLETDEPIALDRLSLPQLDAIDMHYNPSALDEWSGFFRRHEHLSRFYMELHENGDEHIVPITSMLRNLTEITITSVYRGIDEAILSAIIRNHERLMKLEISIPHYNNEFMPIYIEDLRKSFGREWHVRQSRLDKRKYYNIQFIMLERKSAAILD